MTIQLRWPLRVLAIALVPFVLLAVGRGIFFAVQAFALWLELDALTAEAVGGYFGLIGGLAISAGMVFGAFHAWRPLKAEGK